MKMIAALYVEKNGPYAGLPGVDLWDKERDARFYSGPHPVVAHPPCSRWCRLAGLVEKRWGYKKGEDGGTFASALRAVRKYGGVLEHPAYSDAWAKYGLAKPKPGRWIGSGELGYVTQVDQGSYGHAARKSTWLYAFGIAELPSLNWEPAKGKALVSACGNHTAANEKRPRIMKKAAAETPAEFRDMLILIARNSH